MDIPKLIEKYKAGECISYFRKQKDYGGTEKNGNDTPKRYMQKPYILVQQSSDIILCVPIMKNYEQYVKNGTEV